MNALALESAPCAVPAKAERLDYLDATRAFALLLGVLFHASLSFMPYFMGWAMMDVSTSPLVAGFFSVSHSFRMELFFLLAGFFGQVTFHRYDGVKFLRGRAVRLGVPFVTGWFLLRPLLVSAWVAGFASMRGEYQVWPALRDGFKQLSTLPNGIFTGTHLWFLYYLALVTAVVVTLRAIVSAHAPFAAWLRRCADGFVAALASGWWQLPVMALGIAGLLWQMAHWAVDTPDQSLIPNAPVLALYGGFFALGWLIARQPDLMAKFSRLTWLRAAVAVVSIVAVVMLSAIERDPSHPRFAAAHAGFVVAYAVMMWTLVWLTVGVFRVCCARPNTVIRYLADASYWVYLVHLPIVVWLQVVVGNIHAPWWVKLASVTLTTIGIALVSYDAFVRSTWIGAILNGRRRPRIARAISEKHQTGFNHGWTRMNTDAEQLPNGAARESR